MNIAKKITAALILAISVSSISYGQEKNEKKMEAKEHACTAACKDGKHMYAHGEKGHTCTKACKKMEKGTHTDKKM